MNAADVIIVGGGIMGASTALFLRQRGRSVILIERGLVGQQASGVNFGNVRRQGRALEQLPLANRSREIWRRLPELVGEDCEFLPAGHLRVVYTAEQAAKVEAYAREARALGVPLEMLSERMLRERFPYLGRQVHAGCLGTEDGHANPRLLAPAFGRAARQAGAQVMENSPVVSLARTGGDFVIEIDGKGEMRAPNLVIAAGAWAAHMAETFGEPVPLTPLGPQMAVTEPLPYRVRPSIGVSSPDVREMIYFRQVERGNIVIGGCMRGEASIETSRAAAIPEALMIQLEQMARLFPAISGVNIIRTWSGVEGYIADDKPVIGPSSTTPGLFYAFGFCGEGFQLGPGVGDVMAELVDTGRTATPIDHFSISRFRGTAAPA